MNLIKGGGGGGGVQTDGGDNPSVRRRDSRRGFSLQSQSVFV